MNDLDFDELDKAVNSLAARTRQTPDPSASAAARPPEPSVPVGGDIPSADTASSPAAVAPAAEPPASSPSITSSQHGTRLSVRRTAPETAPKNRGHFMDIVAPAAGNNRVGKNPSRTGGVVQPLGDSSSIKPDELKLTPPETPLEPDPSVPQEPEVPAGLPEKKPAKGNEPAWPDPLDFHGAAGKADQPGEPDAKDPPSAPAEAPSQPASSASPFLAETKVEKRPLGAYSDAAPLPAEQVPPVTSPQDDVEAPAAEDKQPAPPLEAISAKPHPTEPETPPPAAPAETPEPDLHRTAMMSIPPQYHTEAKPTDKGKRPVFDTKEYHPPLLEATAHSKKQGQAWVKLAIGLLVLALLAAASYAVFMYVR